jgi:hypothetical protein
LRGTNLLKKKKKKNKKNDHRDLLVATQQSYNFASRIELAKIESGERDFIANCRFFCPNY